MPPAATRPHVPSTLYLAFELGNTEWKLAMTTRVDQTPLVRTMPAAAYEHEMGSEVHTRLPFTNILLSISRTYEQLAQLNEPFAHLNGHHNGHHADPEPEFACHLLRYEKACITEILVSRVRISPRLLTFYSLR